MPKGRDTSQDISRQVSYRMVRDIGEARYQTKHAVLAHHPEHGVVGMLSIDNAQWPARGRGFSDQSGGRGLAVSLVHVSPQFQRQGIGSALYNIAHREMGYAPGHDLVRTPAGERFAASVSSGEGKAGHIPRAQRMPQWGTREESQMATLQAKNWEKGEDIDPTWGRALTPSKPPVNRRRKPVQGELFSGKDYEKPKEPAAGRQAGGKFASRKKSG